MKRISSYGNPDWGMTSNIYPVLIRTPFNAGVFRQARETHPLGATSTVTWGLVEATYLNALYKELDEAVLKWTEFPMETHLSGTVMWHQVRIISGISAVNIGGGFYSVSCEVEHRPGAPLAAVV